MPIPRRAFLASAVVGGVGWVCQYRLPAAEGLKPFSFLIVSDTHLGRNDNPSAEKNWRQAIDEINQSPGEFILHLGDVVDGGRPEQYPLYAKMRKSLNKPIHEIPGNHDPVELFEKRVHAPIDRSFEHQGVRFVLFNNSRQDSHLGFITEKQLAWLATECEAAAKKNAKIIICCHVPVHDNRAPDRGWHVKPESGQTGFYEILQKHEGRVIGVFHGHFHNGIRGWRDHGGVLESLFPSVCYNQNRNLETALASGKASGFFVEELRPGYVLATLGHGELLLRYKPLGADYHGEYRADWNETALR